MTGTTKERLRMSARELTNLVMKPGDQPAPARERTHVMLLGGDQPSLRTLQAILRTRAKVALAEDLPSALEKLSRDEVQAIFCASRFHCGAWSDALCTIGDLHPEIPLIVVNEAGPDFSITGQLPAMYAAGAFDVLAEPGDPLSVMGVLAHALATREAREWQAAG